jgi:hypothetical protein
MNTSLRIAEGCGKSTDLEFANACSRLAQFGVTGISVLLARAIRFIEAPA